MSTYLSILLGILPSCGLLSAHSAARAQDAQAETSAPQEIIAEPTELIQAEGAVDAGHLEALVRSLCTAETAGRRGGSPGYRAAADTVVQELKRIGVQPGAGARPVPPFQGDSQVDSEPDSGTDASSGFYQSVPMVRWSVAEGPEGPAVPRLIATDLEGQQKEFSSGRDFTMLLGDTGAPPAARSWRVVTVGSPADLPAQADPDAALVFTNMMTSEQRGAMFLNKTQKPGDWGLLIQCLSPRAASREVVPEAFTVLDLGEDDPGDKMTVRGPLRALLLNKAVASLQLEVTWEREELPCVNIVGIIPGVGLPGSPELAEEVVVLTANLDHHGTGPKEEGSTKDTTFDGADNNASGVAALLVVAEALVSEPQARTTLLLFATGEEQGQLGVQHQIRFPSLPLEQTRVALEASILGSPDPTLPTPGALWCTSFADTSLGGGFQGADLRVYPDERFRWRYVSRTSTRWYRAQGIIGHRLSSFGDHRNNHTTFDEPRTLDFPHLARATRTLLESVRLLTGAKIPIRKI